MPQIVKVRLQHSGTGFENNPYLKELHELIKSLKGDDTSLIYTFSAPGAPKKPGKAYEKYAGNDTWRLDFEIDFEVFKRALESLKLSKV